MKTLDQLSDSHVLALARFIAGCLRLRASSHWRTRFAECAARDHFVPYVSLTDQMHLRDLVDRHGESVVCRLRTREVLDASHEPVLAGTNTPIVFSQRRPAEGIQRISGGSR